MRTLLHIAIIGLALSAFLAQAAACVPGGPTNQVCVGQSCGLLGQTALDGDGANIIACLNATPNTPPLVWKSQSTGGGVTVPFSFTTCAQGGNDTQCSGPIILSSFLSAAQLPADTNYQIVCSMADINANNISGSPTGFITILDKNIASFDYGLSIFFDDGNGGRSVTHTANCIYYHA